MTKPPFLTINDIANVIKGLRSEYHVLDTIPIDIEEYVEFDLGIEIVPQPDIRKRVNSDAIITRDFKSILIDNAYYKAKNMAGRNRFSIAHEVGHYFLHQDYFMAQCPTCDQDEWINYIANMDDSIYNWLEWHADTFASLLLMPLDDMMQSIENHETMETMSRKFNVSTKAVISRVKKDDIREKFADIMP